MRYRRSILLIIAALAVAVASCSKVSIHGDGFDHTIRHKRDTTARVAMPESRNVLILYSAGYNSLSSWLQDDIKDLLQGWLPGPNRNDNILLVYSHSTVRGGNYSTPNPPTLTRIWQEQDGTTVLDTLTTYPGECYSATAEQLHNALSYVKEAYPANSYGMIFSSHATGYLPSGYYSNPYNYIYGSKGMKHRGGSERCITQPVPYVEREQDPSLPAVKSIGQDQVGTPGNYLSYEMELNDFVDALPMAMEYILFDACLMGGVEVAYALKDKCRYVGFSQTEVLAEGFDYTSLTQHLLDSRTPDPQSVCEDYFHQYDVQSGIYRSATISMTDCSKMEPLAEICHDLFTKYAEGLESIDPSDVQRYYRSDYHWFYDLKDVVAKSGATEDELQQLQDALDRCVIYKAATPEFMQDFEISSYSGLSMYLPADGSSELNKYYRTLEWNKATSLVK